ncbi:MAG: alkaline phosphatase [Dehalococcoidia bacterium]
MPCAKFLCRAPAAIALLFALVLAASVACGEGEEAPDAGIDRGTAQNVILLIGDGMGAAHRTAARLYSVGREGELVMDTLPIGGMSRTWSMEGVVTDSAAAGTALAAGVKTSNKAIAVDSAGNPVETILEKAQEAGKSVGLVTDVQLAHATPASFAAHNPDRNNYLDIALDIFDHDVDVLLGGGEDHFLPVGTPGCYPDDGDRTDDRNLIDEAVAKGYQHVCTGADFNAVDPEVTDRLLGTFADLGMTRPFTPSLPEMTAKAIAILSKNEEGFFLMVEGGQIDWAAHANDALNTLGDTLAFDEAVKAALDFQAEHPDTLVIVTADHTTGGLTIEDVPQDEACPEPNPDDPRECKTALQEDGPFEERGGGSFWLDWTSSHHTAGDVPVTASGPHAIDLAGYYENTHIFEVMREALALSE